MSLQVCHCCGWSKVTSYQGLRIHQGKMGCTPNGMHQQQNLCGQTVQSNVMLDFGFCVETDIVDSPDLSLQVCHCGWTKMTTYRGLRIHQGRMGCTVKGMRVTEHQQEYLCNQTVQSNVMMDFGFCVKTASRSVTVAGPKGPPIGGYESIRGGWDARERSKDPKKESYDSKYNREEREHQRRPPAENIPEGLRRSSRKSSAAAKIMDSFPEPPRSAQRANPARYLEAAQVLTQVRKIPEAPVRRTVERAPELQRQDFGSDLQVQNPFREPLVNPESQLQERCRSQQVDRAVRSPKHVVRSKNREALSEKKNPSVIHPKNKEPPVVLPEDKAVLPKNRDSPEIRPTSRTSLRKLANLSADQENRSPHPLIKTEIESSSFTAKLKEFERISVGARAQPTIRVKEEVQVHVQVNTSKPPVPPKPKVLTGSCLVKAVRSQEEKAENQRVTDNTAATRSSTSSIQDPALFSEVDFSVGMKVKDLARMFSGSCDEKISNKKGKPKEEPQPSQNVKETTNTEESSQVKVSQEIPLTSEQPAFITGMKVKELLQVFTSLDSKTPKKEQQLFEVKICRISFATKEETKTNREEHNEVKTFGDVVTAVSKATEERKPTKTLKVKELVQMFSASSVPLKEKLETNRRTCSEPAPVRRGRK
ncbi:hypothetical protein OJAV_G00179410 [Oryzias javanicus]|uniref:Uncharacterized protein n=1 Tax=Oryzias javanicus TaxID=123683 RepID=A0A437CBX1_ORYJA|nr:hypothetical protein OJAV_G00179410 [Oryzias javanicus]